MEIPTTSPLAALPSFIRIAPVKPGYNNVCWILFH